MKRAKVKVFNDNKYEHRERYKGQNIIIPAGGFIEMDRDDAVQFKGQFFPPQRGGNGVQLPETFKKIRIEYVEEKQAEAKAEHVCMICGFKAESAAGLAAHMRHKHPNQEPIKEE